MIVEQGDFFWMDDTLVPEKSHTYQGSAVWFIRRASEVSDSKENGSSAESRESSDLLNMREVSRELGMGKSWTYQRIKSGEIPSLRIGGNYKVRRRDLMEWIEEQRV